MKYAFVFFCVGILVGCNWNVNGDKFGEPGGPGLGQVWKIKVNNQTTGPITLTVTPTVTTTSKVDYSDGPLTQRVVAPGETLVEVRTNLEPYAEPIGSLLSVATSRTYFISLEGLPTPYSAAGCPKGYSIRSGANVSGLFYADFVESPHAYRSFLLPEGMAFDDPFFIVIVITITPDQNVEFSLDPTTVAKLVPVPEALATH